MDKQMKYEMMALVRETLTATLENAEEKWLTGEQLIAQFGMFSKSWLKTYGHTLPRTQAVTLDADGNEHKTGWCYPLHKINRMLQDGSIKRLTI